jgi:hypothetical protein
MSSYEAYAQAQSKYTGLLGASLALSLIKVKNFELAKKFIPAASEFIKKYSNFPFNEETNHFHFLAKQFELIENGKFDDIDYERAEKSLNQLKVKAFIKANETRDKVYKRDPPPFYIST